MDGHNHHDKRHDDLPEDDSSIEILSDGGDSHTRDTESEWSIYSPRRSSMAGREMSLMGFQKLSIHSKPTTIVNGNGRQYIERRDLEDGGLPYSADFYLNGDVWKLSGEDCFLMSPRRYIAEVTIEGTVNVDGAVEFEEAVRMLMKHLKLEKVLLDKELEECNKTRGVLVMALDKLADESEENINRKREVMVLRMLLKKYGSSLNMAFKHDLRNCSWLSGEIMSPLDNYVTKVLKLIQRNEFLNQLRDSSLSDDFISVAIQEVLDHHRVQLAVICPSSMKDKLQELPDDCILYVSVDDMLLFTDLTTLNEAIFEAAWPMIFSKFMSKVREISNEQFVEFDPLSNRIFLYICKSIQEVAEQSSAHINNGNAIIYSEALGWIVTTPQKESQTLYSKYLGQQLEILVKLANHFEPGGPFRTSRFPYEFKLFQNMDAIPEAVRIWMCLLDDCMKDLHQADLDKTQMLSCFFKSYVSFVASDDFGSETWECLRTITHDALRSLADKSSDQRKPTSSDLVLSEYKNMISSCVDKLPRKLFEKKCYDIETTLQQIICKAMEMNLPPDKFSEFSNVFKQLLNDLSDLQLEWFVRLSPSNQRSLLLQSQCIAPVKSMWNDLECFKVMDLHCFIGMFTFLHKSKQIPKHYQLKAIQALLKNVETLISRQSWNDGDGFLDKDLLDATTVMINSIRSSLVLLNKQPDYCNFEDFLLKMSKPCPSVIEGEVQDLPPYTDKIGFEDESLELLVSRFERIIPKVQLKNRLKIFRTKFNEHLAKSVKLPSKSRIESIVSDLKSKIEPKHVASWTDEFKRYELPEVLAGLCAVWSIIDSGYDSSFEEMPSQRLICYVLIIFEDYKNQLIQISTNENKQFLLGITAALLALYGYKVEIVCFNSHLTRTNSLDWIELFRSFSIISNISYESLEDMARERSRGIYEKYMTYINKCFGFETEANNDIELKDATENERSVLLIEDTDIILQEVALSMPFKRYVLPTIPGLEIVQRRFFQKKCLNMDKINLFIEKRIGGSVGKKLRQYLIRPNCYKILEGNLFEEVEYTNKTLFLKHLESMNNAESIKEYCAGDNQYGCLSLGYIPFPYQHLLKSFPLVQGFTRDLDENSDDVHILSYHFGIHLTVDVSDIFQSIPTKFDPKKDFLYIDSDDDQDLVDPVSVAIKAAIDRNCEVLIFFKGVQKMEQVSQTQLLRQLNVKAIKTASNRENLSEHDLLDNEISLLMVCNGKFSIDHVHVIQTFFSEDAKEEDLIRRQAERGHSNGSYELIIPSVRNMSRFQEAYINRKEDITYDWLVKNGRHHTFDEIKQWSAMNSEQYMKVKRFLKLVTR